MPQQWVNVETVEGSTVILRLPQDGGKPCIVNPQSLPKGKIECSAAISPERKLSLNDVKEFAIKASGGAQNSESFAKALYSFVSGDGQVVESDSTGSPKKEAADAKKDPPKKEAARKKEAKKKGGEKAEAAAPVAEDPEKARKDKLKKVIKEGGKRGVEIEGAADMGGLQFFCTAVDLPDGDLDLLVESMKAMNQKSDPTEEERKGGSGHIGKMIFSAGSEQLAVVAYVPEEKQDQLSCEEWLKLVLDSQGGKIESVAKDICAGKVLANPGKNVFPLKIRESMILEANNFLRKKGLFPEDNDDDDDYVFGDDDFPSM